MDTADEAEAEGDVRTHGKETTEEQRGEVIRFLYDRVARSKRFLTKVMFLVAVARPRWNTTRDQWFDGHIGMWLCMRTELAKRNSKNRPKGTPITVTVNLDRDGLGACC